MASIRVDKVTKRYGSRLLFDELNFAVEDGEFMVIIGPSGCGKSTLLRIVAGIETMNGGSVVIGDDDVSNRHPSDRDVSMVFQDYALYPHMTVQENLSFGLKARREPRDSINEKVLQTATALDIHELLERRPGQLSGGQRQRVALGRAMIRGPQAYLMDEPLSNLDAHLRVQMRAELIEFHRRTSGTILYVTHDQAEAMTMGERIAVMNNGRVEQIGSPTEIYDQPANLFVAGFLGSPRMNFIRANVIGQTKENLVVRAGDLEWTVPGATLSKQTDQVIVGFRPEAVTGVGPDQTLEQGTATFARAVDYVEHLGHELILHLHAESAEDPGLIARLRVDTPDPPHGRRTYGVRPSSVTIFSAEGQAIFHGSRIRPPQHLAPARAVP